MNGSGQYYFLYKDHLGSFLTLTDLSGNIEAQQSFDAWGRYRSPVDWSYNLSSYSGNPEWLDRGYTGHEMLREFNLINMNARIYDPIIARMLQPDNYVQDATYTQNYNRYSYVLNNPTAFTDPSGNFVVVDSWIIGFVHGFFSTNYNRGGAAWNEANHRAGNDARIWGGLFIADKNKTYGGRFWELFSRFTWQLPQTLGGFLTTQSYNTLGLGGGVESVDYKYGATVVKTNGDWGGITQGSYIVGDNRIEADANNPLFQHE